MCPWDGDEVRGAEAAAAASPMCPEWCCLQGIFAHLDAQSQRHSGCFVSGEPCIFFSKISSKGQNLKTYTEKIKSYTDDSVEVEVPLNCFEVPFVKN